MSHVYSSPSSSEWNAGRCAPSGSSSSLDEKASNALEAMLREHVKDLIITESFLSMIRSRYHISPEYDLRILEVGQRPFDLFPNGFGLSIAAFEARLRLPLHPLVVSCLQYWMISPSHIAPNSWRYVVVFVRECRAARIDTSHTLFLACFRLGKS
ncbi:hypothetical protein GW17_00032002 [Ensete ventricosum]|uniref:Uncharacterized protein n=1 Tax=Ensete ventricosum TaxID=4639 RepID=A0A444E346_ENSVE|nr:hypothetical protein GW17_00032002 [Ensete ventricosum]RZR75023.1 hypothetical protein BHM03_00047786 [Ensete ventricosum]